MTEHTVKAFDQDIGELRGLVSAMGGRSESALLGAMRSLIRGDLEAARNIVAEDKKIDALEDEVEKLAVRIIALRAPMADDLREVIAALKIAGTIERMGDYAKNIAKRIPVIESMRKIEAIALLPAMGNLVAEMVHDVLDAFAARDGEKAADVCQRDKTVDDFYNSIFRALVTFMMENPQSIGGAAHLLFVAKNLERIGDHATNVAEMVYYAATGDKLAERIKGDDMPGAKKV
jgi:phosphate transport system protein